MVVAGSSVTILGCPKKNDEIDFFNEVLLAGLEVLLVAIVRLFPLGFSIV